MYIIKIGTDKYLPEVEAIVKDITQCFKIYWQYYNSVQSIHDEFFVQVTCLDTFSHYDITKGISTTNTCSSDFIKCTKNHSYMIDMVKSLKSQQ
jgi:hypothetical protein